MFRRLVAMVAGGVLLVGAGGCAQEVSGDGGPSGDVLAEASATEESSSEPTDDGSSDSTDDSEPTDDGSSDGGSEGPVSCDDVTPSGDPFAYDNGLTVAVGDFELYTPTPQAAGADPGTTSFVVTVMWANTSDQPVTADVAIVNGFASDVPGSEVYDIGQDVGGSFGFDLAPGDCVAEKHAYAFASPDFSNLRIEVQPGFEYDPAVFTGKV